MKDLPILSIIIPVFNTAKYLNICFESVLHQSFKDWECLIINDGSSDGSGEICDEWSKRDKRFRTFHKSNGGQASARNIGLRESRGKFIMFLDSDDKICNNNLIESLINLMSNSSSTSFIQYTLRAYSDNDVLKFSTGVKDDVKLSSQSEIVKSFMEKCITTIVCDKIFRKTEQFSNLRFPEGVYYEDECFLLDVISISDKANLSPIGYYHYLQREGSTTHQEFNLRHTKDLCKKDLHGVEFAKKYDYARKLHLEYIRGAFREYKNAQLLSDKEELSENKKLLRVNLPTFHEMWDNQFPFSIQDKITMTIVKLFGFNPLLAIIKHKRKS